MTFKPYIPPDPLSQIKAYVAAQVQVEDVLRHGSNALKQRALTLAHRDEAQVALKDLGTKIKRKAVGVEWQEHESPVPSSSRREEPLDTLDALDALDALLNAAPARRSKESLPAESAMDDGVPLIRSSFSKKRKTEPAPRVEEVKPTLKEYKR